ncbi:MAG: hypothetical protein SXQ77_06160, partial [Halobacteria archaeon]|nr:hypothetical protein [Halobacteria archaeon]
NIAKEHPDSVKPAIPYLGDLLDVKYPPAQKNALGCLAELADDYPDEVEKLLPKIMKFRSTSDMRVRDNALRVVHAL